MKKRIFWPLIFGSVLFLGGCSSGNQSSLAPAVPNKTPTSQPVSNQVPNQPAQPVTASNMVTIKNFAFSPASLTIKAGTTVTWTNQDSASHTISSASFSSGNLATGDKFQFTFTNPGTYAYSCGIHPSMQGTITVQ
jgi:plastocyanin